MKELHYKDVLLLPRFATCGSRSDVDVSQRLGDLFFRLPIVPANMKTVIDVNLAKWLSGNDYFYVMHRFGVDLLSFVKEMNITGRRFSSISVGVNEDSKQLIKCFSDSCIPVHYITIDIAHGHCLKMKEMISYIKELLPETFIIAGNVATPEAVSDLESWGANSIKVGVGPGLACSTKLQTGFSRPQFSCVLECSRVSKLPIIADGGIRECGDIAKALVAGASWVMAGGLFAEVEEAAGKTIIRSDGVRVKEYFGSASEHNKENKEYIEGRKVEIPIRGTIASKMREIEQALRSSVSYAGGPSLDALLRTKWVVC